MYISALKPAFKGGGRLNQNEKRSCSGARGGDLLPGINPQRTNLSLLPLRAVWRAVLRVAGLSACIKTRGDYEIAVRKVKSVTLGEDQAVI